MPVRMKYEWGFSFWLPALYYVYTYIPTVALFDARAEKGSERELAAPKFAARSTRTKLIIGNFGD